MSFITWEDKNKLNANNSRYLGFATIVLFIGGVILPWLFHNNVNLYSTLGFNISTFILGVGTYLSAVRVGFKNTFETNDDWKTDVQAISAVANLIVPCIFIVSNHTI